jgi:hypothetical protein
MKTVSISIRETYEACVNVWVNDLRVQWCYQAFCERNHFLRLAAGLINLPGHKSQREIVIGIESCLQQGSRKAVFSL